MQSPPQRAVVYAVNVPPSAGHRAHLAVQLGESLASLRAHDTATDVRVFAYGASERIDEMKLAALADRHRAHLHAKGPYEDALARYVSPHRARVLADYGVLHKWLALAEVVTEQCLYVDNDTCFFGPASHLFEAYASADFYAREEPFSSRSHAGYDPAYIDEARLFALAESEGARPLPTYNLGAVMLNHRMGPRLAALLPELLGYVWRLCLGIVRDVEPAAYTSEDQIVRMARDGADTTDALPYPSSNYWIVEQLALLLALGKLEPFGHAVFDRADVVQGVEFHFVTPTALPTLAHYYSSNTEPFFAWRKGLKS